MAEKFQYLPSVPIDHLQAFLRKSEEMPQPPKEEPAPSRPSMQIARMVIVPTGAGMGYAEAFNAVEGKLPPNLLHDKYLVKTKKYKGLQSYYSAWALEVAVYPRSGQAFSFTNGDIIDDIKDDQGRAWIFPRSSLTNDDRIHLPGVGLIVTPLSVTINGDRVIVESVPENVKVLQNFMQKDGWGKMDEDTGLPVNPISGIPIERSLWRRDGQGVRPLARYSGSDSNRLLVSAVDRQDRRLGVASVSRAFL